MATKYHHFGDGDDKLEDYELRELPRMERDSSNSFVDGNRASSMASTNQDWQGNGHVLPPKGLPLHRRGLITPSIAIVSSITIIVVIGLSIFSFLVQYFEPSVSPNNLDTSVSCDLWSQNTSSVQNAFTINLRGASKLTFTQAKAIDVIWQLFVGAGGRVCLAWISYVVFMDGLTRLIEQSPVSYMLYASITFQTTSIYTTWYAMKAVVVSKGWRPKLFLAWFSLSTIYVLGFPTLMSATTGYLTPSTAGFNMPDHSFVNSNSDDLTNCLNVPAGSLIGIPNGISNVTYADFLALASGESCQCNRVAITSPTNRATVNATVPLYEATNSNQPPDIISSSEDGTGSPHSEILITNYTTNITFRGISRIFHNYKFSSQGQFCYRNQTLPYQSLKEVAGCLPESYFVWGFSGLLVKIVLALQTLWAFGMLAVWLDANIYGVLCLNGRKIRGSFRAADDLSEAMREVLGNEYCAYSDSQLAHALKNQPGVRYYSDDIDSKGTSHIGLTSIKLRKLALDNSKLYGTRKGQHR